MKFLAEHSIGGRVWECRHFNTESASFEDELLGFCHSTGKIAKDYLASKIFEEIKNTNKNYFEIQIAVEIGLCICVDDMNCGDFCYPCAKFNYSLKPGDPGFYLNKFMEMDREIGHEILARYQNLLHF